LGSEEAFGVVGLFSRLSLCDLRLQLAPKLFLKEGFVFAEDLPFVAVE
jgi:hypothetical protein